MNSRDIYNTPIVVLCGGQGTRFRKVSELCPKLIAPLPNGQTYLTWLLNHLTLGFNNITLATGHKHEQIFSYVQTLPLHHRRRISFSREFTPMGTGGAVLRAINKQYSPYVVVINGDTINDISLYTFIRDSIQTFPFYASISCISDSSRHDAGFIYVSPDNRVLSFQEKDLSIHNTSLISRGVYLFHSNTLRSNFPSRCSIEYDVLPSLVHNFSLYAYPSTGISLDIGTYERYRALNTLYQ